MEASVVANKPELVIPYLNREMFREACKRAKSEIEAILARDGATWGPQYVQVRVWNPRNNVIYTRRFGRWQPWKDAWGPRKDFGKIAEAKLFTSWKYRMDTCDLTDQYVDEIMRDKEGRPYTGGIFRNGMATSASGALGTTDHEISEVLSYEILAGELKDGCHLLARCEAYLECPDCSEDDEGSEIRVEMRNNNLYLVRVSDGERSDLPFYMENVNGLVKLTGGNEYPLDVLRITRKAAA